MIWRKKLCVLTMCFIGYHTYCSHCTHICISMESSRVKHCQQQSTFWWLMIFNDCLVCTTGAASGSNALLQLTTIAAVCRRCGAPLPWCAIVQFHCNTLCLIIALISVHSIALFAYVGCSCAEAKHVCRHYPCHAKCSTYYNQLQLQLQLQFPKWGLLITFAGFVDKLTVAPESGTAVSGVTRTRWHLNRYYS